MKKARRDGRAGKRYGQGVDRAAWQAHLERHAALCERWGRPEQVDRAEALRLLGITEITSLDDVVAFRYASREAAEAFAASNLENKGYRSLGIRETSDGVIGVTHIPLPVSRQ